MKNKNKGFTLLEVMVALFIVAIALGGAIRVMGNAAQNSSRLTNKAFAQWVGLNQVAKLRIERAWPKLGETKGDAEMADRQWKWVQQTIKTEDKRVKRVEVSVWLESDSGSDAGSFATVVGFLSEP